MLRGFRGPFLTVGMGFAPQRTGHLTLHVDDFAASRGALELKGVSFADDTLDTGVCHTASSPIQTPTL